MPDTPEKPLSSQFDQVRSLLQGAPLSTSWARVEWALDEFRGLSLEEKQELAPDLLSHSLRTSYPGQFQAALKTLPHHWLRLHLEGWIRQYLDPNDGFALQQLLLGLLYGLDDDLARKFAIEGLKSSDSYGVECAKEFLEELDAEESRARSVSE